MALRRSFLRSSTTKEEKASIKNEEISKELALKMIEFEHEVEKNCQPKVINELIHLYSEAIEFYSQKNNPKYLDFQNRMHKMLINPRVLASLKQDSSSNSPKKNSTNPIRPKTPESKLISTEVNDELFEIKENFKEIKEKPLVMESPAVENRVNDAQQKNPSFPGLFLDTQTLRETSPDFPRPLKSPHFAEIKSPKFATSASYSKFEQSKQFSAQKNRTLVKKKYSETLSKNDPQAKKTRNLKIIIDRHSSNTKDTATRAVADFKSQDSALDRRLASRKQIQLTRSMTLNSYSPTEISGIFDCDLSDYEDHDASTKSSCFVIEEQTMETSDNYERMLEEIMEKNFGEKALKIAETKQKYLTQINEISGMGEVMDMLVKQMRINMEEEISLIVQEFDSKRKEEISKLKEFKLV